MILFDTPRPVNFRKFKVTAHCGSTLPGDEGTRELLAFGKSIGLKARWLQYKGHPKEHFDLFDGAIQRATEKGARQVNSREWVQRVVLPKRRQRKGISYTLIEVGCGSAALSLWLLGAKRAVVPYQGNKWKFRRSLVDIASSMGYSGLPNKVILVDPGPWGVAHNVIFDSIKRRELISRLEFLAKKDARSVFDRFQGKVPHREEIGFTAEFLFLQRLAFSGKAVGIREGRWSSPGFNKTSAYGLESTNKFGGINPMIPSLIRALKGYNKSLATFNQVSVQSFQEMAHPGRYIEGRTLAYIDPTYEGGTGYPNGNITRDEVLSLAKGYLEGGASVIVSEACPLPLRGWNHAQLYTGTDSNSPFRGKHEEWVTYNISSRERNRIENWYVYMVRANDGSIYIGCSKDPIRRLKEHNSTKKGARYFRKKGRRPGILIWCAHVRGGKVNAHRVEHWLKRHRRKWKLSFIQKDDQEANECLPDRLSHCRLWMVPLENIPK